MILLYVHATENWIKSLYVKQNPMNNLERGSERKVAIHSNVSSSPQAFVLTQQLAPTTKQNSYSCMSWPKICKTSGWMSFSRFCCWMWYMWFWFLFGVWNLEDGVTRLHWYPIRVQHFCLLAGKDGRVLVRQHQIGWCSTCWMSLAMRIPAGFDCLPSACLAMPAGARCWPLRPTLPLAALSWSSRPRLSLAEGRSRHRWPISLRMPAGPTEPAFVRFIVLRARM